MIVEVQICIANKMRMSWFCQLLERIYTSGKAKCGKIEVNQNPKEKR